MSDNSDQDTFALNMLWTLIKMPFQWLWGKLTGRRT